MRVRRAVAVDPADKAKPNQSVNFALMIHKIHTGENMTEFNQTYTIVGFGGSHNDFSEVRYPAMTLSGGSCRHGQVLHVPRQQLRSRFPDRQEQRDRSARQDEPGRRHHLGLHGCHMSLSALSHAVAQTDPKFGESCDVCHAVGKDFDVVKAHAGRITT